MTSKISILSGASWLGLAQLVKIGLQLVAIAVLARILPTSDYGLMAMASTVTAFASLFRDFGTAAAIIQRSKVDEILCSTVFWFNLALGTALTVAIYTLSPVASALLLEPRLTPILRALSPVFLILSLGIVQAAMLERSLNFRALCTTEILAGAVGLVVAIQLALNGWGVYALVAQSLTTALCSGVLLWLLSNWRPSLKVDRDSLDTIWRFSWNLFAFNWANYFQRNADTVIVGRFLGATALGPYNLAYKILLFPLQNITFVVARASFPIYSRNQHRKDEIGRHYINMLGTISLLTAPLMMFIWVVREPLVVLVFGRRWLPAAEIIAWLAPVGFFQSMISTSGTILTSVGRTDLLRNLGFLGIPVFILSMAGGLKWGVTGVAAGYCFGNFLWIYPVIGTVLKQVDVEFHRFIAAVYRPAFLSLAIGGAIRPWVNDELVASLGPAIVVAGSSICIVTTYTVTAWFLVPSAKALPIFSKLRERNEP